MLQFPVISEGNMKVKCYCAVHEHIIRDRSRSEYQQSMSQMPM